MLYNIAISDKQYELVISSLSAIQKNVPKEIWEKKKGTYHYESSYICPALLAGNKHNMLYSMLAEQAEKKTRK